MTAPEVENRRSMKHHMRIDMLLKFRSRSVARAGKSQSSVRHGAIREPPEARSASSTKDLRLQFRRYSTMVRNFGWKSNHRIGENREVFEECTSISDLEEENAQDQNALHLACMNYPTLDAIEKIVKKSPELVSQKNSLAQTPLHVASAYGASPRVITFLIELYDDAPNLRDVKGQTPLHLACSCTKLCDAGFEDSSCRRDLRKGPSYAVVRTICQAAPESVNMEDVQGITPLECAICSETGPKILRLLQRTSETAWAGGSTGGDCRRLSWWSLPEKELLHKIPAESHQKYLAEETSTLQTGKIKRKEGRRFSMPRLLNM